MDDDAAIATFYLWELQSYQSRFRTGIVAVGVVFYHSVFIIIVATGNEKAGGDDEWQI